MPSLVKAIRDKYDPAEEETDHLNVCVVFVPKSGPNIGPSGCLSLPQRLTLDHCGINCSGEGQEIAELCEKVQELDLSKNHITNWHEVFTIIKHIPELHFLNLLMNKMDEGTTDAITGTYPCMKNLVLNSTEVSWQTVALLLNTFPSLSELHLSLNQYSTVDIPDNTKHKNLARLFLNECAINRWEDVVNLSELHLSLNQYSTVDIPDNTKHKNLARLFLNECAINRWEDVMKLGEAFPNLESLNLIQTELETLHNEDESYKVFPCLTTLNLSNTKLQSWTEIDKFRKFPALTNLRLSGIPFLENMEAKQRRQHLVARLPTITTLNGSCIGEVEREDAERAFIRYYMDHNDRPDRYTELEIKHGKLDPIVHVDLTATTKMKLLVKFEEKSEFMEIELTQTVRDFKKLLQNFSGVPASKMRVSYIENFEGVYKDFVPLRLPNKTLLSLNINEGDEFQVDRIG